MLKAQAQVTDEAHHQWQQQVMAQIQRHREEAEADASLWRLRSLDSQDEAGSAGLFGVAAGLAATIQLTRLLATPGSPSNGTGA